MFDWCKGSDLRAFVRANISGAAYDDWLEGWMHAFVQHRFKLWAPVDMLDIELGSGPRPYRDMFVAQGARLETVDANSLFDPAELAKRRQKYGLITLMSLEREQCLQPFDFQRPLRFVEMLLNASTMLQNGGVLIWSDLYCFSHGPDSAHSFFEPAGIFQIMFHRQFVPMASDFVNAGRVAMFHDLDTLFVRHEAILQHSSRQERVTRVCCAVRRRGRCRVGYVGPRKGPRVPLPIRGWRALRRRVSFLMRG